MTQSEAPVGLPLADGSRASSRRSGNRVDSEGRALLEIAEIASEIAQVASGSPTLAPGASAIALPVLLQLRWLAIVGQSGLLLSGWAFGAPLPYALMWSIIGLALLSNVALSRSREQIDLARVLPLVLSFDTLLLTSLLALSGGPHNPFTALYVVHIALGAVTTTARGTAWIAALAGLGYAAMFRWHVPLDLWHGGMHGGGHAADGAALGPHLIGMWVALAIVAATIAYFITRLVQQLATAERVAARNERLASLTTLAAGAAHELGSPLGTIAVASQEIARTATGEVREDARLIRDEVQRCRAILDRMTGSAIQPNSLRDSARVDAIVARALTTLGPRAERVRVDCPEAAAGHSLLIDPLSQALTTLLRNALDASSGEVELSVTSSGSSLEFRVRDRGTGMPRKVLSRLGEPFVTTKDPGEGTGLGIYVVRLIAEQLGGTLRFTSRAGAGTTALLCLPLSNSKPYVC